MKIITNKSTAAFSYMLRSISILIGISLFYVIWKGFTSESNNLEDITFEILLMIMGFIATGIFFVSYGLFVKSAYSDEFIDFQDLKISAKYKRRFAPKISMSEVANSISLIEQLLFPKYDEFFVKHENISDIKIDTLTVDIKTKKGSIYSFPLRSCKFRDVKTIKAEFNKLTGS